MSIPTGTSVNIPMRSLTVRLRLENAGDSVKVEVISAKKNDDSIVVTDSMGNTYRVEEGYWYSRNMVGSAALVITAVSQYGLIKLEATPL